MWQAWQVRQALTFWGGRAEFQVWGPGSRGIRGVGRNGHMAGLAGWAGSDFQGGRAEFRVCILPLFIPLFTLIYPYFTLILP